jgi:hypothetical protein
MVRESSEYSRFPTRRWSRKGGPARYRKAGLARFTRLVHYIALVWLCGGMFVLGCLAYETQRVKAYPISFSLPASWTALPEEQRQTLQLETRKQLSAVYREFSGQDLNYYDRLPYFGAYESGDGEQRLIFQVMRFAPAENYLDQIRKEFQSKADWGKAHGLVESVAIQPNRKIGRFWCLELRMERPDGGHDYVAALFDPDKSYQVVQVSFISDPNARDTGESVFETAVSTLEIDFTYQVKIREGKITISDEAQRFVMIADVINPEASRFLLVFQDPHWDYEAHEHLFYGLARLFEANEGLIPESALLTEGSPRGTVIEEWPLFAAEPECDTEIVKLILRSYLVPGHVALGGCLGNLIPIFGTEDRERYQRSALLWAEGKEDQWRASVADRNISIARATLDVAKRYRNPILVVGGMHLLNTVDRARPGLAQYFSDAGFGVVYLEPIPNVAVQEDPGAIGQYRRVIELPRTGQYEEYRRQFAETHSVPVGSADGVTVPPNPREAAALIAELKKSPRGAGATGDRPEKVPASARGPDFRGLTKRLTSILRAALRGKGNFSLGKATRRLADLLKRGWVGDDATVASDGKTLISSDQMRKYRSASFKKGGRKGGLIQANFERREKPGGPWTHNGHLTITD